MPSCLRLEKPDSGHADTTSITVQVRGTSRNAMKPRIQCVLAQWNPGFTASDSGPNAVEARFHGRPSSGAMLCRVLWSLSSQRTLLGARPTRE
jgi:hypothetical protein